MNIWPSIKTAAQFAWAKIETGIKWGTSVASEPNGTGSSSRVCLGLVTLTVCGALVGHLYLHRSLPDRDTLSGLAELLAVGSGGYVSNKFTSRGGA